MVNNDNFQKICQGLLFKRRTLFKAGTMVTEVNTDFYPNVKETPFLGRHLKELSSPRPRQTTQIRAGLPHRLTLKTNISATYFPALPASPRSVRQTKVELPIQPQEGSLRNV